MVAMVPLRMSPKRRTDFVDHCLLRLFCFSGLHGLPSLRVILLCRIKGPKRLTDIDRFSGVTVENTRIVHGICHHVLSLHFCLIGLFRLDSLRNILLCPFRIQGHRLTDIDICRSSPGIGMVEFTRIGAVLPVSGVQVGVFGVKGFDQQ